MNEVNYGTRINNDPYDFYTTPIDTIEKLLRYEKLSDNVWECACGIGSISDVLEQHGYNVCNTDIIKRVDKCEVFDFLSKTKHFNGDIITNPPYKLCLEFVKQALNDINDGNKVIMLLKIQFLESAKRYEELFKENPPVRVYVNISRVKCLPNNQPLHNGSAICFCWFVWEKGFKGNPQIKWI